MTRKHLGLDTRDRKGLRVLSKDEAEGSDMLICMAWSDPPILPDNAMGICHDCAARIQYRPDAPARPTKVCTLCSVDRLLGSRA